MNLVAVFECRLRELKVTKQKHYSRLPYYCSYLIVYHFPIFLNLEPGTWNSSIFLGQHSFPHYVAGRACNQWAT